jgi:hypothetical protein
MLTVYFGAALVVAWQFGVMAIILGALLFAAFRTEHLHPRIIQKERGGGRKSVQAGDPVPAVFQVPGVDGAERSCAQGDPGFHQASE